MGSIDTANQDRGTEIVTADMLAGATIGQQSRICKILGLNENGTKLADLQTSIVELAKKLDSLDDIETPEALGEAKKLATQMRSIADFIALSDSIGVKQEGIKFTVTTKPPKADMTLMDVFKELGDKVDIEYIRNNLKSVDLNAKLGTEEIELIIFDRPGTEKENHAFIEEQGLSLEVDPKRVLYMAAVLRKKAIDGNLNEAEANLYNILKTGFIRFGSGSAGVYVNDFWRRRPPCEWQLLSLLGSDPSDFPGVPCAAGSESK